MAVYIEMLWSLTFDSVEEIISNKEILLIFVFYTVEELVSDKEKLQETAKEIMAQELVKMGLALVSYQVKDIKDCRWKTLT